MVADECQPDVMVRRYLNQCLGYKATQDLSVTDLLAEVATEMTVELRSLDRATWLFKGPTG